LGRQVARGAERKRTAKDATEATQKRPSTAASRESPSNVVELMSVHVAPP
jgi:hypothetical protein